MFQTTNQWIVLREKEQSTFLTLGWSLKQAGEQLGFNMMKNPLLCQLNYGSTIQYLMVRDSMYRVYVYIYIYTYMGYQLSINIFFS